MTQKETPSSLGARWGEIDDYRYLCSEIFSLLPATLLPRAFLMYRRYAHIFYDIFTVTVGQSAPVTDPWEVGTFAPPTNWQWYLPLTLLLTSLAAQVYLALHRNFSWLAATGVDDLLFFFICLDSCGRNSVGV